MQPQGPYGAPPQYPSYNPTPGNPYQQPPSQHDPQRYDFFMNPSKPPQKSMLPGRNSLAVRAGLIVGGAVLFMVIIGLILSFIPDKVNTKDLIAVAQAQYGLNSLCSSGNTTHAAQQTTLNFSKTCSSAMFTAQSETTTYTAKHGKKIGDKELKLGVNTKAAAELKAAISATNYDPTFLSLSETEIVSYSNKLKTAYKNAQLKSEKDLLQKQYDGAKLLLEEVQRLQQ